MCPPGQGYQLGVELYPKTTDKSLTIGNPMILFNVIDAEHFDFVQFRFPGIVYLVVYKIVSHPYVYMCTV